MNPYKRELKQVAHYVQSFFNAHSGVHLLYHNAEHTKAVVSAAEQIAEYYQLNDREYFILMAAAWFHDVGHYIENDTFNENTKLMRKETGHCFPHCFDSFSNNNKYSINTL